MSQPSFIQYAYLDFKNDEAVNHFYEALKEEVEANKIKILPYSLIAKEKSPDLQKEVIEILDAWHTNTVREKGVDKRLQSHRPTLVFHAEGGDEFDTEEFYQHRLENVNTRGLLFELIIRAILERKEIRKCVAEDCERYFVPTPRGRKQEYCSRQCYERIRSRKRRAKRK